MSKFVTFLKKSFKYIALSALGLFIIVALIGFFSYQYDEYMARVDESICFECEIEDESEKYVRFILESTKSSRSKSRYYSGVKVLAQTKVPNSEEKYYEWLTDYSAAQTPYEIFLVKSLYQALKVMENPKDEDIKKYITIDRISLKAKRYSGYKGGTVQSLQCQLFTNEERLDLEKRVADSIQKTLANRQI